MAYFTYKEMENILAETGELQENTTANLFHCKSGPNNDRLYVTNKGECVLFYCHHCGKRGRLLVKRAAYKKASAPAKKKYYHHSPSLPSDGLSEPLEWPVTALKWFSSGGLQMADIRALGAVYSPSQSRTYVPVSVDGEANGWIARKVGDGDGPKYLAKFKDNDKGVWIRRVSLDSTIVLVEDALSAYKLTLAGYNAIALLGTSLKNETFYYITQRYNKYIVWLDNDNPQVIKNSNIIANKLSLVGNVRIIRNCNDPKHYTETELKEILEP